MELKANGNTALQCICIILGSSAFIREGIQYNGGKTMTPRHSISVSRFEQLPQMFQFECAARQIRYRNGKGSEMTVKAV